MSLSHILIKISFTMNEFPLAEQESVFFDRGTNKKKFECFDQSTSNNSLLGGKKKSLITMLLIIGKHQGSARVLVSFRTLHLLSSCHPGRMKTQEIGSGTGVFSWCSKRHLKPFLPQPLKPTKDQILTFAIRTAAWHGRSSLGRSKDVQSCTHFLLSAHLLRKFIFDSIKVKSPTSQFCKGLSCSTRKLFLRSTTRRSFASVHKDKTILEEFSKTLFSIKFLEMNLLLNKNHVLIYSKAICRGLLIRIVPFFNSGSDQQSTRHKTF